MAELLPVSVIIGATLGAVMTVAFRTSNQYTLDTALIMLGLGALMGIGIMLV